jgi:hypothetical protein
MKWNSDSCQSSEHNRLKIFVSTVFTHRSHRRRLNLGRKDSVCSLVVPLLGPFIWTDIVKDPLEVSTGFVVFTLELGAAVKVDVVLPAVPKKKQFASIKV